MTDQENLALALAEIAQLKKRLSQAHKDFVNLEKKNAELQRQNRVLENEIFDLKESKKFTFKKSKNGSRTGKTADELENELSWRWENDLQEERRRNEMGRQGIFG